MYRHLDPEKVIETAVKLQTRVKERFPDSSLARLTAELVVVAQQSAERADEIARPLWGLRAGVGAFLVLMLSALGTIVYHLDVEWRLRDIGSLVQFVEAGTNEIVLMGAAVFFLLTFEQRYKRRRALKALHELRSLAHIVDMHQLTKDPDRLRRPGADTASSPGRTLTPFELSRYLEYCSEIWAVIGKVAAVYAQTFEDEAALTAVDEIEDLTTGLSNKVWQKLTILDAKAAKD
ncbi:MAG: hypothetical protein FD126_2134 [Elusimicrobia bacterium]|nr:MAG: hypothetical protein FD126_2134 [Elusimicrobiota bacterium]